MKKKLFIGTILPSIAALAVIGSGFSLWIFNDSSSVEATGSVGINVTKVLDIKNSTIDVLHNADTDTLNPCKLQFDQTSNALNGINPNGTGLTWLNAQTAKFKLVDPTDKDYATAFDDSVKYTFTTTITVSSTLNSYVSFAFNTAATSTTAVTSGTWEGKAADGDSGNYVYTYTFDSTSLTNKSESDLKAGVCFFDFSSVTASYQADMEPTSLGEDKTSDKSYLKMLNAVKDEKISVAYEVKASIVSKN